VLRAYLGAYLGAYLEVTMRRRFSSRLHAQGRIGWILLWLLGVPIPILLVLYLLRGCT